MEMSKEGISDIVEKKEMKEFGKKKIE